MLRSSVFSKIHPFVSNFLNSHPEVSSRLNELLLRAGIHIPIDVYVSNVVISSMLTFFGSMTLGILLLTLTNLPLSFTVLFVLLVPVVTFLFFLFVIPLMRASSIRSKLDVELPFFTAFLSMVVASGVSIARGIHYVVRRPIFSETSRFLRQIYIRFMFYGRSVFEAITEVCRFIPHERLRAILSGYVTTVLTGGDVIHYMDLVTRDVINYRSATVRSTVSFVINFITGLTVGVLMIIVMLEIVAYLPVLGVGVQVLSPEELDVVFTLLMFSPLLFIVFGATTRGIYSGSMKYRRRHFVYIAALFGIGCLCGLALYHLLPSEITIQFGSVSSVVKKDLSILIMLTILCGCFAAGAWYDRIYRERISLERGLVRFLVDLAEARKTGLSVERCFELLAERDYGAFTKILREAARQLRLGVWIGRIVDMVVSRSTSTLVDTYMRLLMSSIEFGGGHVKALESLATFATTMMGIEDEARRSAKQILIIALMAVVTLLITVIFMNILSIGTIQFLSSPVATGAGGYAFPVSKEQLAMLSELNSRIILFVILCSIALGFLAGRVCYGDVLQSFRVIALLSAVSLVLYVFSPIVQSIVLGIGG